MKNVIHAKMKQNALEQQSMLRFTLALQEPQTDLQQIKQHSQIKPFRFTRINLKGLLRWDYNLGPLKNKNVTALIY